MQLTVCIRAAIQGIISLLTALLDIFTNNRRLHVGDFVEMLLQDLLQNLIPRACTTLSQVVGCGA